MFKKYIFSLFLCIFLISLYSNSGNAEDFDTLEISVGTVDSGNVNSLRESDNNFFNVTETVGVPAFLFYMNITDTDLTDGKIWSTGFKGFYNGSLGHNVDFDIYDWTVLDWINVGSVDESVLPTIRYNNFTSGDYVNNDGDVNTRIIHTVGGNINHEIGLDYAQIWEQEFDSNDTFNQQINMQINSLDCNDETYNMNGYDLIINTTLIIDNTGIFKGNVSSILDVNGDVVINNGAILNLNNDENHEFGSLTTNSGGTYSATSGTTKITSETAAQYALETKSGSTFTHNNGRVTFAMSGAGSYSNLYIAGTGNLYDVTQNSAAEIRIISATTMANDLTVMSGSFVFAGGATRHLTVLGDVVINGGSLVGSVNPVNAIFGGLSIENGGTYSATPLSTIIQQSFILNSAATLNQNNGLISCGTGTDLLKTVTSNGNWIITSDIDTNSFIVSNTDEFDLNGNRLNSSGTFTIQNGGTVDLDSSILEVGTLIIGDTANFYTYDTTTLIINNQWTIDKDTTDIFLSTLICNGTISYNGVGASKNIELTINNDNLFRSSTGEFNISALATYPFRLISNNTNTTIDMNNMTDYFLFNVEVTNFYNIDTDYITISGLDVTSNFMFDFIDPVIQNTLVNNTIQDKEISNFINLSFNITELSFIHSYNFTIQKESNGAFYEQVQLNYSTPVNFTQITKNLNLTYFPNGYYWFNVSAYDTHNSLHSKKSKDIISDTKIYIGNKKVGKYDKQKIKEKSKEIKLKNYKTNQTYYTLEFEDKTEHLIYWNDISYNYKLFHYGILNSDLMVRFKIIAENINYISYSYYKGHFLINDFYYYDLSDFDGNIVVSNKMSDNKNEWYEITLLKNEWHSLYIGAIVEIDPLSGAVNEGETYYRFQVINNQTYNASIDYISVSPQVEGQTIRYNGSSDGPVNITNHVWISSIDGIFHNTSTANFTYILSIGTHLISYYVINEFDEISNTDQIGHVVIVNPVAIINSVGISGDTLILNGGGIVHNNSFQKRAWRSSIDGEFYNGTSNPLTINGLSVGNHTIFYKVQDSFNNWSSEINITVSITNISIDDEISLLWYQKGDDFTLVILYMVMFGMLIGISVVVFITLFRRMR